MGGVQPSKTMADALAELYEAMSGGRAGEVESRYSSDDGSVFVGTDEAEYWTDSAQHNADVRPFFEAGDDGAARWEAGDDVRAVREGTVGWTFDRPTLTLPDGTVMHPRVTLVWHLEGDHWKVVHSHASFGR